MNDKYILNDKGEPVPEPDIAKCSRATEGGVRIWRIK